ncbi:MAG: hypothetical protein HY606_00025 [Planctomycetes bacterium]|nr:hypothetical protein [Planctomycetota bacterium]
MKSLSVGLITLFSLQLISCSGIVYITEHKNEGITKVYNVNLETAWDISEEIFKWENIMIQRHKDKQQLTGYIIGHKYQPDLGVKICVWIDSVDDFHTKITVVSKRNPPYVILKHFYAETFINAFDATVQEFHKTNSLPKEPLPYEKIQSPLSHRLLTAASYIFLIIIYFNILT